MTVQWFFYCSRTNLNAKFKPAQRGQSVPRSVGSLSRHLASLLGSCEKGVELQSAVTGVQIRCFDEEKANLFTYSVSASSSSSPVTAAEERARRPLRPTELAGAGRVLALGDERVQVSDADLLLCLGLYGEQH